MTLAELVEEYLEVHQAAPATIEKLRWLLAKATATFGEVQLIDLRAEEICAWRRMLPEGHRFEATQALRQVLNAAVAWQLIDLNPAKRGVPNPSRRFPEKRPFGSWDENRTLAKQLGPVAGPMVLFGAATGLRPAELCRTRAARRRSSRRRGLCPAPVRARAGQTTEDAAESPLRADPVGRARGDRAVTGVRESTAVPSAARRPHRYAQLPRPRVAARTARGRDRPCASADQREPWRPWVEVPISGSVVRARQAASCSLGSHYEPSARRSCPFGVAVERENRIR
jgi:hypothetical protein